MLLPTEKIERAVRVASRVHQTQVRRDDEITPYIMHPFCVALILLNYTFDENVISAGLLHDTVEESGDYSFDDIEKEFGVVVRQIVSEVTLLFPNKTRENWVERKKMYLDHVRKASEEGLLVCAADKLHDMRTNLFAYKELGDELWTHFRGNKEQKIWYYEEIFSILKPSLRNSILDQWELTLIKIKAI